jgi:hypothetical protein
MTEQGSNPLGRTVLLSCLLALSSLATEAAPLREDGTVAVKAGDFLSSLGVCTHMTQGEDHPVKVAECLIYLGIRNVRDDGTKNAGKLQAFIELHKASGAKFSLLPILGNVEASLQEWKTLAAEGALLACEGPNEPNNWPVTYNGQKSSIKTTFLPIAEFQRDFYAAVKADPALARVPVFHSSEAGGSQPDNCGLQFLTIPPGAGTKLPEGTNYADYANCHNYVCGHNLKGITEDNIAWNAEDPTLKGQWDGMYAEYGRTWNGKIFEGYKIEELAKVPRVTTETGWTTRPSKESSALSEEEQGKLFVNLYLAAYKRGWSYTFVYMLKDSPGQGSWGLVHSDYSPKASAKYLHNLTAILADPSSGSFSPGSLAYSIPGQPAAVHDLLLQKQDGTFELAVWGERAKGSNEVIVKLGGTFRSVRIYDPTLGAEPVHSLTQVSSVTLTLSDHASVIEILPGGR